MELHTLAPAKGSRKVRNRVGRGNGSGNGKTSGRGHKGQKARSGGGVPAWFEGGQMPLYRRIPSIGFISRRRVRGENLHNTVSLSQLNNFDDGATVDPDTLRARGYATKKALKAGVKVLGSGELTKKLTVKVHAITKGARAKIEEKGGTVELIVPVVSEKKAAKGKKGK